MNKACYHNVTFRLISRLKNYALIIIFSYACGRSAASPDRDSDPRSVFFSGVLDRIIIITVGSLFYNISDINCWDPQLHWWWYVCKPLTIASFLWVTYTLISNLILDTILNGQSTCEIFSSSTGLSLVRSFFFVWSPFSVCPYFKCRIT